MSGSGSSEVWVIVSSRDMRPMKHLEHSLRKRLLKRLWIPLISVLLLGALLSFGLADHFGNVVHDRWLLDSATTLATQLRADRGKLILDLPQSAVEMFEWDSVDRIYEEVTSPSEIGRA